MSRPPAAWPVRYWLRDDLCRALACSHNTLRQLIRQGVLPPPILRLPGHRARWDADELDAWFTAAHSGADRDTLRTLTTTLVTSRTAAGKGSGGGL